MKKRLTALITALAVIGTAGAPIAENGLISPIISTMAAKETSGICGDLTWVIDNGTLTVSGNGKMPDYTNYSGNTCPWTRSDIVDIVIESGVENIGNYAFYYCKNLKTVTIPETVTTIGSYAFSESSLAEIALPEGVKTIGSFAFSQCTSLADISIPKTVERIGGRAFLGTPWLESNKKEGESFVINSVLVDAADAEGSYTVPEGITSIAGYAFYYSSVTDITIPDGVRYIGENAFSYVRSLTEVDISGTVTEIADSAFSDCAKLSRINVSEKNTAYASKDGVLYDKALSRLIKYPQGSTGTFEMPKTVKTIGQGAFSGAKELTGVTFSDSVELIDDEAFTNCIRLKSITIPDSVTFIGHSLFKGCRAMKDASIGSGITELPDNTFNGCRALTKVDLKGDITYIGSSSFSWCDRLESIKLPENVKIICSEAFWCCTSLKTVEMPAALDIIEQRAFYQCYSLEDIALPNCLTIIGREAFFDCKSLKKIVIPETVTDIEGGACMSYNLSDGSSTMSHQGAFAGCTGLEEVQLLGGVTRLNQSVFYNCTSLKKVELPDTVIDIDDYAFGNCTSMSEVKFSKKLTRINKFAFQGCKSLTALDFPESLKTIGESAFEGCTGLKNINFPEKIWKIDKSAFSGCMSLETVDIPESVTTIGDGAFESYGTAAKYTYEFFAMNEVSSKLYDGTSSSIYIKTDNPDLSSFSISTSAPLSEKNKKLKDVEYKDPDDKNIIKAVDGGYIWTFSVENAGDYGFLVTETGADGKKSLAAAVDITVRDSVAEKWAWIDSVIASQTTEKMTNFEKMSAVSGYLMKNFKYYPNDGKYLLFLGSVADGPYFSAYCWDSYVSPSVLCDFAKRIGGFDEIVDLYSSYGDYGYTWNNGHYLCYCAAGDKHQVYNACPTSNTGLVEVELIDFKDETKLYLLADSKAYDLSACKPLTITGKEGTAAEKFAKDNGITFGSGQPAEVAGDLDGDGKVGTADLVLLEKWLLGSGELPDWEKADLCKDRRIDVYDMVMLRKAVTEK